LTLREPGAPARQAEVAPAARHLAGELPAGPVRDRLATVLGVRALLPLVRVRSRTRSLAVLNRDAKTVVRLEVEQGQVVGEGRKPAALAPRLRVQLGRHSGAPRGGRAASPRPRGCGRSRGCGRG
jgi:hypothetical protein